MNDEFEVGKMPHIRIEACHGDLVVKGWDKTTVLVKADQADVNEVDDGLTITSNGRLRLSVPENASLTVTKAQGDIVIRSVEGTVRIDESAGDIILSAIAAAELGDIQGDLSAKNIDGAVSAHNISGDAIFRQVGSITLNDVHGDLSARGVDGSVTANTISGDTGLRNISGDVTIKVGHRDANLRFLEGQTAIGRIHGDIRLYGELAIGKHIFAADGDIVLRWPVHTALALTATAPEIINRLQLDNVVETGDSLTGQIGEDGTVIMLTANGRIVLKDLQAVREEWDPFQGDDFGFDFTLDMEGLGAQITAQVNEQVSRITADLNSKFGADFAQTLAEKIARKAERAAERAEKAAERARQRAEQKMQQQPRRATPPSGSPPPKKASAEEQLKILKMVEQGTISPDEASMLLEALED